jgi:hypothetical protein
MIVRVDALHDSDDESLHAGASNLSQALYISSIPRLSTPAMRSSDGQCARSECLLATTVEDIQMMSRTEH